MESVEIQQVPSLTLDDLAKIQRTLQRHAAARDPTNIVAVGFGPKIRGGVQSETMSARFIVREKKATVAAKRRIPKVETVRLFDEATRTYNRLLVPTDVVEHGPPKPVAVSAHFGGRHATTAAVVRWTTHDPPPREPAAGDQPVAAWRWGVMTVAHVVSDKSSAAPRIERVVTCGHPPDDFPGTLAAVGRIPGGPDVALVETGFDRLWLSGFLPRADLPFLPRLSAEDVLRWIREGGSGYIHSDRATGRWLFETYFPDREVSGLGRLRHVMQYASADARGPARPFGPGTSGSMLVDGGVPAGMQVAALAPAFDRAYAQLTLATLPWLARATQSTALGIVHVV